MLPDRSIVCLLRHMRLSSIQTRGEAYGIFARLHQICNPSGRRAAHRHLARSIGKIKPLFTRAPHQRRVSAGGGLAGRPPRATRSARRAAGACAHRQTGSNVWAWLH
jgi:hypothetical protein